MRDTGVRVAKINTRRTALTLPCALHSVVLDRSLHTELIMTLAQLKSTRCIGGRRIAVPKVCLYQHRNP